MSRVSYLNTYTPTYTRALRSYANSGFFARELDAEDHAFIEGIRTRGCIDVPMSGDELVRRKPLLEELEFWTHPWGIEPHVEHRRGIDVIQQHRAEVELSRALYRAQLATTQAQRAADKALAAAELERERKEWEANKKRVEQERARRLAQQAQADIEWEQARPAWYRGETYQQYQDKQKEWERQRRSARHYVPEWKRLEGEAERMAEYHARNVKRWRRFAKRSLKVWREVAAGRAEEAAHQAQAARDELARQVVEQVARQEEEAKRAAVAHWQVKTKCQPGACRATPSCAPGVCNRANFFAHRERHRQEQQAAEREAEAKARRIKADEEEWQRLENLRNYEARQRIGVCQPGTCCAHNCCPPGECRISLPRAAARTREPWLTEAAEQLKRNICTHVNGSWPREWTIDQLMQATRCADREFLIRCCNEVVAEGRMRSKP